MGKADELAVLFCGGAGGKEEPELLSGVCYQIEKFRPLLVSALRDRGRPDGGRQDLLHNLFVNLFDNPDQAKYRSYLDLLEDCVNRIIEEEICLDPQTWNEERTADRICALLRFLRFMNETEEGEEK